MTMRFQLFLDFHNSGKIYRTFEVVEDWMIFQSELDHLTMLCRKKLQRFSQHWEWKGDSTFESTSSMKILGSLF